MLRWWFDAASRLNERFRPAWGCLILMGPLVRSVKTMSMTTQKGFDGNKQLTGRKRFLVMDVLGLVLSLSITSANTGERAGALLVLASLGRRFERF